MSEDDRLSHAPWTDAEVASLNDYQACPFVHPYTGTRGADGEQVDLIATPDGWIERIGGPVVQTWAQRSTADRSWESPLLKALAKRPWRLTDA
jgi:hypothetical protein